MDDNKGLYSLLIDDGRPPLLVSAVALFTSGAFAVFLSVRREFLPHDVSYLGMTADQLCQLAQCHVVSFMFHDRVAFGGALIAVAVLYLWLAVVPLKAGEKWAWWAFAVSGLIGFGSFLSYLGHGYLDTWHGVATLVLLPLFGLGLARSYSRSRVVSSGWLRTDEWRKSGKLLRIGRLGLLATGLGIMLAGSVILFLGTTDVFVREDIEFMGVSREALDQVNPHLVPLIAHDRAGFGGALATTGMLVFVSSWYARPKRAFHDTMAIAGASGFGLAIGTHFYEGYVNPVHLAPAFAGIVMFAASIVAEILGKRRMEHVSISKSIGP